MNQLKEAYPFLKKHVQDYIMLYKDEKNNYFVTNSTATLDEKTLDSIGASFIEQERKNRRELKNLSSIEERNGYPLLMFIAGSNFGNIYDSEVDTNNMIDMAIANKVNTIYIQGLIYSTYYHNQICIYFSHLYHKRLIQYHVFQVTYRHILCLDYL